MRLHARSVGLVAAMLAAFGAAAAQPAAPAGERLLVQFKADAPSLRARALSARDDAATAAAVLQQRASALGIRHGLPLAAGAAVSARAQVVTVPGMDARSLAARLAADPEVEFAEPTQRMRRLAVPNDPRFLAVGGSGPAVGQWYLRTPTPLFVSAIDAQSAWDVTRGSADVLVAVLDTGVRHNHPDLQGKLVGGYDFVTDPDISVDGDGRDADPSDPGDWVSAAEAGSGKFADCQATDSSWHGTQVSGLVGAATDNGEGMAGAGWNVRVLPLRVLGKCYGDSADIQAAMRWAAGLDVPGVPANPNPAKVINLSLGGPGSCSAAYQSAIDAVIAAGVTVVAAAGNSAGKAVGTPGNCSGVVTVAALRHIGTKVGFSDVGPQVAIAAPGGNCINVGENEPCLYPLLTTFDNGTTVPGSPTYTDSFDYSVGTSFSAPLVSGAVALLLSQRPGLVPAQVRAMLQSSARHFPTSGAEPTVVACQPPGTAEQLECYCTTTTCGAGMLNVPALLNATAPPPPPPPPQPPADAGGGGGGAVDAQALLGLLVAGIAAARRRRKV